MPRKQPCPLTRRIVAKKQTYEGQFQWITDDLVQFQRSDRNSTSYTEIDTNPDHWTFFVVFNLAPGQVQVRTNEGLHSLEGTMAIWFPPFSIIEWRLSPGKLNWYGFISAAPPPEALPRKSICFKFTEPDLPKTKEAIYQMVTRAENPVIIEREHNSTPLSESIKRTIQQRFREDLLISELSKEFGVSHEYIVRILKKTYGVTPVYLRSRLRVFSAILPLLKGQEVTNVAYDSGFSDLCRFTKQFSKMMKAPPLHYQRAK